MIYELLDYGIQNKKSLTELKKALAIDSTRHIRRLIAKERKEGKLIIADPKGGYYLPQNRNEIALYVNHAQKGAVSKLGTLKPYINNLKENENQLQLDLVKG